MEDNFSESLTKWFEYLSHKALREFLQFSRDYGLTILQMNILMRLYYRGSSDVTHLVDTMQVTKGAASQMVERMVQLDLIERLEDPADRRVRQIHLTNKGRELIEMSIAARRKWLEDIANRLSLPQQMEIMKSLTYLMEAIKTNEKELPPASHS
jgi:DNA-binding MarR family transcriptional regulator